MLNQVILFRDTMCRTGEMGLTEDSGTEAPPSDTVRSIGSAMAMIFAMWLTLLAMVVLTGCL